MIADPDDRAALFLRRLLSRPWRLLQDPAGRGRWNMAVDAALLDEAREPTLRFYAWSPPCLSLGRFQSGDGIDFEALRRRGWDAVRRPTGGRAVLHQHEVTYSLVLPPDIVADAGVRTTYCALGRLLFRGLDRLLDCADLQPGDEGRPRDRGPNCFAAAQPADAVLPGGKLVGSAQLRRRGALLQHGSILTGLDRPAWSEILGGTGAAVALNDLLGGPVEAATVVRALLEGLAREGVRAEGSRLTDAEHARAESYEQQRLRDPLAPTAWAIAQ